MKEKKQFIHSSKKIVSFRDISQDWSRKKERHMKNIIGKIALNHRWDWMNGLLSNRENEWSEPTYTQSCEQLFWDTVHLSYSSSD